MTAATGSALNRYVDEGCFEWNAAVGADDKRVPLTHADLGIGIANGHPDFLNICSRRTSKPHVCKYLLPYRTQGQTSTKLRPSTLECQAVATTAPLSADVGRLIGGTDPSHSPPQSCIQVGFILAY